MKKIEEITERELAEVIFKGEMVPALREWVTSQGWEIQSWPSGTDAQGADPHYWSFIVTPIEVPAHAIEGLTPEQVEGYAKAWNESGTGMDL